MGRKKIVLRQDKNPVAFVAGAWKTWAPEKTGAREGDTRGERERLHGRPPKIVSRPLSNYLAAVAWSVKRFDRKRLTPRESPSPGTVLSFAHYFRAPATQAKNPVATRLTHVDIAWLMCSLRDIFTGSDMPNGHARSQSEEEVPITMQSNADFNAVQQKLAVKKPFYKGIFKYVFR